ncbi:MAG: site-specific integrase [Salinivirgaceae bacterium]|nr:site-specific integrase [Salinivirgaceae bacterium]
MGRPRINKDEKVAQKARFDFIHSRRGDDKLELLINFGYSTRRYVATKIEIPKSAWNAEEQSVVKQYPNSDKINLYLLQLKSRYEAVELDCMTRGIPFNPEALNMGLKIGSAGVVAYCREKIDIDVKRELYAPGTVKHYTTFCNVLERFEKQMGELLTFDILNKDMLIQLDIFYKSIYTSFETVRKQFTYLHKFCKTAKEDGLLTHDPFAGFKIERGRETKQTMRDALKADELRRLEQIAADGWLDDNTQLVLDRFLLSCYTGLRISDNADLRRTDITYDEDGHLVIDRITLKNKIRVLLPLHYLFDGKGEAIVNKYMERYKLNQYVFPQLSDQKTNSKLKLIAAAAQIRNLGLSFHIARHTCATMLAEKTGNPYTIMQLLGHSDIKISMTYIHNSYATVVNSLAGVKW